MTDPNIWYFVLALLLMIAAIWLIALGIGIFAEEADKDANFPLCLFLTVIGAFCLCVSLMMLMIQSLRIVGVSP